MPDPNNNGLNLDVVPKVNDVSAGGIDPSGIGLATPSEQSHYSRKQMAEALPSYGQKRYQASIDPRDYSYYIENGIFENEGLEARRAANQSLGSKFVGFLNQTVIGEIIGGSLSGLGALGELPTNGFDLNADFDNWLTRLGDSVTQWTQEATPVHEYKPGESWQMNDIGWWFNRGKSVVSTLSMLVPAMAVTKGISYLGKAAKAVGQAGKIKGTRLGRTLSWVDNAEGLTRELPKLLINAGVMRHAENVKESFQTYKDVYNQALERLQFDADFDEWLNSDAGKEFRKGGGTTKEEAAQFVAAKAGWRSYQFNTANIAFDLVQATALLKPFRLTRGASDKASKAARAAKLKAAGKTPSKFNKFGTAISPFAFALTRQSTEGVEEAINFMGGKEGQFYAKQLLGDAGESTFGERLSEYFKDPEMWESAFWGVAGGLVFEGASNMLTKGDRAFEDDLIQRMNNRNSSIAKFSGAIQQVQTGIEEGQIDATDGARMIGNIKAEMALEIGLDHAETGTIDALLIQLDNQQTKEALKETMTADEVKEMGEDVVDRGAEKTKRDILLVEELYKKARKKVQSRPISRKAKFAMARAIASKEYAKRKHLENIGSLETEISEIKNSDANYNKVQASTKDLYLELKALQDYKKELEAQRVAQMEEKSVFLSRRGYFKRKTEEADKRIAKIQEQINNLEEGATSSIGEGSVLYDINKDVFGKLIQKVDREIENDLLSEDVSELLTYEGAVKYDETLTKIDKAKEEIKNEAELAQYKANIDKTVSGADLDAAVSELEREVKNQKDKQRLAYAKKKLKELKEKQKFLKDNKKLDEGETKDDGSQPQDTEEDTEDTDDTDQEEIDKEAQQREAEDKATGEMANIKKEVGSVVGDKLKQMVDKLLTSNKKIDEMIEYLRKRKDGKKLENAPNARRYLRDKIDELERKKTAKKVDTYKQINVGDKYEKNGVTYEVTRIETSSKGTRVYYIKDNETVTMDADAFSALITTGEMVAIVETEVVSVEDITVDQIDSIITSLPPSSQQDKKYAAVWFESVRKFFDKLEFHLGVPVPEHITELLFELDKIGTRVMLDHNPNNKDVATFSPKSNVIFINLHALRQLKLDNEFLYNNIIGHELIHALQTANYPYGTKKREDLDTALTALINKYEKSLTGNQYKPILDNKSSNPEELLTYALTNTAVYDALPVEMRDELLDLVDNVFTGFVQYMEALSADSTNDPNSPQTPPPTILKVEITDAARLRAEQRGIDYSKITGTGQNGRITVQDVEKYIKDNNISILEDIKVETVETNNAVVENSNNIWLSYLNLGMTKDGVIDAKMYNNNIKRIYGFDPGMTQKQLEEVIRAILSPDTNTGSTVEIVPTGQGITIQTTDGTPLGFLNKLSNLQKDLAFARRISQINDEATIKAEAKKAKGNQKRLAYRKLNELQGDTKNKPFSTEVDLLQRQVDSVSEITNTITNALSRDANAKFFTKIVRKTSGNLLQTGEYRNLNEVFPKLDEVFIAPTTTLSGQRSNTLVSNKDGSKRYVRNPDSTDYTNADELYYGGTIYVMAPGANITESDIQTYVPVPLKVGNINEATANEVHDILWELIDKLHSLYGQNGVDIIKNEDVIALKERLNDLVNVVKHDKKNGDFITIYNDKIEFSFGEPDANGQMQKGYIYLINNRGEKVANFQYQDQQGNKPMLTDGRKRKVKALNGMSKKNKEIFKKAIVRAFQQKRHNVNYKKLLSNEEYKGESNYLQYLMKQGVLQTDLATVTDPQGKIVKDKRGNALPNVTSKTTDKVKNSNLVIAIDSKISVKSNVINQQTRSASLQPTQQTKTKVKAKKQKKSETLKTSATDVNQALDTLFNSPTRELIVDEEDFATKITIKGRKRLAGDEIFEITDLGNGQYRVSIELDNSGIARTKKVTGAVDTTKRIDIDKARAWWKKTFGDNVDFDVQMNNIITRQGVEAWGLFVDGMVKISEMAVQGTEFHEAFHVVFWLYNNEQQRQELLDEYRKKYGNVGDVALEEYMADDFMDYMLKKGNTTKVDGKTKGFFAKLWKAIRDFFRPGHQSKVEQLFERIDSGEFNYAPDQRLVNYAKNVTRTKVVEGFTRQEESEIISLMAYKFLNYTDSQPELTIGAIRENRGLDPKAAIKRSLRRDQREVETDEHAMNIERVIRNIDKFYPKTLEYVKRQFGVTVDDNLTNLEINEIDKKWDDTSIFGTSQKDSISNYIKKTIMMTPKYAEDATLDENNNVVGDTYQDTFLGLEKFLDFNRVYPYIMRNMIGATNLDEMLARLNLMAQHDTSIYGIIAKLHSDTNLQAAWLSQFRKQSPDKFVILIEEEGIKVDSANKNTSYYILSDQWKNNLVSNIETMSKEDISAMVTNATKRLNQILFDAKSAEDVGKNFDKIVNEATSLLNDLGISVSKAMIKKTMANPVYSRFFGGVDSMITELITNPISTALGEVNAFAQAEEDVAFEFNSHGRFNLLAQHVNLYQYDLIESSYFDVKGNNVYSVLNPHFLSLFFDKVKAVTDSGTVNKEQAEQELLQVLKDYARDPAMQYSNWLWDTQGNSGMLTLTETKDLNTGKTIRTRNIENAELNKKFLAKFRYSMLDGIKDTVERNGQQYSDMSDGTWLISQLSAYLGNENTGQEVNIPILIPSDSGNISFIASHRYTGFKDGTLSKNSNLYKAVRNTVFQEIERMKAARDLMFMYDESLNNGRGGYVAKEHAPGPSTDTTVDYTKLEKNYHWTELDSNNMPILMKGGKPTGKVFTFFGMPSMNNLDVFTSGVYHADKLGPEKKAEVRRELNDNIDAFIAEQIAEGKRLYGDKRNSQGKVVKEGVESFIQQHPEYGRYNSFTDLIGEYMLNSFISNTEQFNFFVGTHPEYKGGKDTNKRAKEIIAPGIPLAGIHSGYSYFGASIADVNLKSDIYNSIANTVADSLRDANPKYRRMRFNTDNIQEYKPDYTKMNDLEKAVHNIVKGYLGITIGDGQGYITLDRYERLLKDYGRWNPTYERLFRKVRAGEKLNRNDLGLLLQPLKGFYYGRDYNAYTNKHDSNQVKYSTVPLIPQLVVGTEAEKLINWMEDNNLQEVFFESAEKVGSQHIIPLTDGNGNIVDEMLEKYSTRATTANENTSYQFREYYNHNWRLQLDVPDHLVDTNNKLGTQIAKLIISNLPADAMYSLPIMYDEAGEVIEAEEMVAADLIDHYFDVMAANIEEDAQNLLDRIGAVKEGDKYILKDKQAIKDILDGEIERRGISDNYRDAIELVEQEDGTYEFALPLFLNNMASKWESILTSLFTNNVTDQKLPGGSAVLLSNAFLQNKKPTVATLDEVGTQGINWHQDIIDRNDYKLRMTKMEGGKVVFAEAILPAWSKQFFKETGTDNQGNPIYELDDINNVPKEVRSMMWYRIPNEEKYSDVVVTVVGFLPTAMGSTIVLPDEIVTSTGADFDVDKKFGGIPHFEVLEDKRGNRYYNKIQYSESDAGFEERFYRYLRTKEAKRVKQAVIEQNADFFNELKAQAELAGQVATETRAKLKDVLNTRDVKNDEILRLLTELSPGLQFNKLNDAYAFINERIKLFENALNDIKEAYDLESLKLSDIANDEAREAVQSTTQTISNLSKLRKFIKTDRFDVTETRDEVKRTRKQIDELYKTRSEALAAFRGEVYEAQRKEFLKLSPFEQNDRKARDNRIIDIWMGILSNPVHYAETMSPQSFEDGANVMAEIRDITGESVSDINPHTVSGQLYFRKQNIAGRALKGMAADSNAFLSVAQVSKMKFKDELSYNVKYRVGKLTEEEKAYNEKMAQDGTPDRAIKRYTIKGLEAKYGKENVKREGDFVTVKHNRLAWNADGSFTNAGDKVTTTHASQILAMILDIVKEGIPANVNTYTFYPYITMLNTGISVRYASMFIKQPILEQLAEDYLENQGPAAEGTGYEIEEIKRRYQTSLFTLLYKENYSNFNGTYKNSEAYKNAMWAVKNGRPINLLAEQAAMLGYDATGKTDYAFSVEELKDQLQAYQDIQDNKGKPRTEESQAARIEFLRGQLKVLEMYKKYRKTGEGYQDIMRAMNADKVGSGPSLDVTNKMNRNILHATFYPDFGDQALAMNELSTRVVDQAVNYEAVGEGARVLVNVNGKDIPATAAVFPKMFGEKHKSVYRIMEVYKENSNDLSYEILNPEFVKYSPAFQTLLKSYMRQTGRNYNEDQANALYKYASAVLYGDHPMLRMSDGSRLLGVDQDVITNEADWSNMSVANKVAYMKEKYKDQLENDSHILNYLKVKTTKDDIERNGFQMLEFVNTKTDNMTDDRLMDSFMEMWNGAMSGNPDSLLSDLAKDMIQYTYLTNGFTMQKNSFAKLIPSEILIDQGFGDFLRTMQLKVQDPGFFYNNHPNMIDNFMRNNWANRNVVPRAFTKTKKSKDGYQVVGVNWNPDPVNGVIVTNPAQLEKSPKELRKSDYILVPYFKKVQDVNGKVRKELVREVLYKKHYTNENIGYYPVERLGGRFFNEYVADTNIESNRVKYSEDQYISVIETGEDLGAKNIAGNAYRRHYKGLNRPVFKRLYMNATTAIGTGTINQAFGKDTNTGDYDAGTLAMVVADQKGASLNIRKQLFSGKALKDNYANIYTVLTAGGTIALASDSLSTGEKMITEHLDGYVQRGAATKREINNITYYSKVGYRMNTLDENTDNLNDDESNIVDENCKQ